jgi:hypothetical protein
LKVIDYTQENALQVIPKGSVDFILDTMGEAMSFLSLMVPHTSTIVSISTLPSGSQFQDAGFFKRPSKPQVPLPVRLFLDGADMIRKLRAWRWGVDYTYMFLVSSGEELDQLRTIVEEGKLVPVVGSRTNIKDIEAIRKICMQAYEGKGGIGKAVITVSP